MPCRAVRHISTWSTGCAIIAVKRRVPTTLEHAFGRANTQPSAANICRNGASTFARCSVSCSGTQVSFRQPDCCILHMICAEINGKNHAISHIQHGYIWHPKGADGRPKDLSPAAFCIFCCAVTCTKKVTRKLRLAVSDSSECT